MAADSIKYTERELIRRIQGLVGGSDNELIRGIGDDCAVVRRKGDELAWLLTTDTLTEKIHFNLDWHPPFLLGRKSAAVNLSDIAAMGGRPRFALLAAALPEKALWFEEFISGFIAALEEQETILVGGDTVRAGSEAVLTVTIVGEVDAEKVLYRSGAKENDLVWVSGCLGNAAAGLELCRRGLTDRWQKLIASHLDPEAQVKLGRLLADSGLVNAMIDLSDGLATDLAHICKASAVGAEIFAEKIPLTDELQEAATALHMSALDLAIRGGEDYHLLFTSRSGEQEVAGLRRLVADNAGPDIFCVGRIVAGQGVHLVQAGRVSEISFQGYEHFR